MTKLRPNILYIMSDDHSAQAMSCYSGRINQTPNIDRIAREGMRFERCFCTNSICAPSRAVILTGKHSHLNGVRTLGDTMDGRQPTFPKMLQKAGYQTAIVGKWHLGHGGVCDPAGFNYSEVLPGQGVYRNPTFIHAGGKRSIKGYVTDIITDLSIEWIRKREKTRPFCLLCHHKAPHSPWEPDEKHAHMYEEERIPEPENLQDDYKNRANAIRSAQCHLDRRLVESFKNWGKANPPDELDRRALREWMYQAYVKDYLRCVASIDDNVGRLLELLDEERIAEDTVVIYTSDQGMFVGEHGMFDKRFMYEESLRMPFVVRNPREIEGGSVCEQMALNLDFAPTLLDLAGVAIPPDMQGRSLRPFLRGETPTGWRTSMYYRYWMHMAHLGVHAHYGVRTERHKLIYYYAEALDATGAIDDPRPPEWELFDLEKDPMEMNSVYDDPSYGGIVRELKAELARLRNEAQDERTPWKD